MDRNTLTGLLLIAAIMFGFYYCSKPAPRPDNTPANTAQQVSQQTAVDAQRPWDSSDSLALVQAIQNAGTENNGAISADIAPVRLTLAPDGTVSGTVAVADTIIDYVDIASGNASLAPGTRTGALAALRTFVSHARRYAGFAPYFSGTDTTAVLENDLVKVSLSGHGARVSQVMLKKYDTEVGDTRQPVELFRAASDAYGFTFNTSDQRIDTRDLYFTLKERTDTSVTMAISPAPGAEWAIRYTLAPESYTVRMEILQHGMMNILPGSTASMDFNWKQTLGRNEKGRTFEERNSAIYYKCVGDNPDDLSSTSDKSKQISTAVRWVAFKNQFFSSVILAKEPFRSADLSSRVLNNDPNYLKTMTMTASVPYNVADGCASSMTFYFGPNDYPLLSSLDKKLDLGEDLGLTRLIPLGWGIFRWINTLIVIPVFTFLSQNCHIANYGIIILLLTIFIKILIFPFTFKSYQSQAKMRVLAPEIKAINDKYPDQNDALKRQQETMKLYSRAGASPFSGCLPMLLQMPVLIAMFSFFPSAIELRGQSFLWAHDLSAPDSILTLPFSIPFYGNQVSLFCLLMTIVNVIYIRISMASQPTGNAMPGMKWMQYLMPVMFLFIFNDYASGLSYYYFISLLITIIQTWVFRRFTDEDKLRAQMAENAKKPKKNGGCLNMAGLEEAARQAEAAQRAQQKRRR